MKKQKISYWLSLAMLLMAIMAVGQEIKGTFAIENVQTGKVLRVMDAQSADGTPIVSYMPVNWKCVTWDFRYIDGRTYQLKNLFTGKAFQPENGVREGAVLRQREFVSERTEQQYEFISVDKNIYLIRPKNTELYLTPSDEEGALNSKIVLAPKLEEPGLQYWKIYEQHPKQ